MFGDGSDDRGALELEGASDHLSADACRCNRRGAEEDVRMSTMGDGRRTI